MMEIIVTVIICSVISMVINAFLSLIVCKVVLKITSNTLVDIIEECEKADKEKIFFDVWNKHNN